LPMEVCEVVPVSILNFAHTCYWTRF
jgi:hypothetical protein